MRPALLIIDLQKQYYDTSPTAQPEMDKAIPYINYAADLFRQKQLPVFLIHHIDEGSNCVPGQLGFTMHPDIIQAETDVVIHKHYGSAFIETPLADKLQELGVDTIVLTGISTEYCVLSTYCHAEAYHIGAVMLKEAVASVDGNTEAVLRFTEHITIHALARFLN